MTRRNYPRPPISEAVIDLRFQPDVLGTDLLRTLRSAVGDKYQGPENHQDKVVLRASVQADELATAANKSRHLTFMQSANRRRLLGCGDGMLTTHVLAPYPGWESFIGHAEEAVTAVAQVLADRPFRRIAVRYIDRISIPLNESKSIYDYFTVVPTRPASMPSGLKGFHFVTQAEDEDNETTAVLAIASAPSDDPERPVVLYDLTVSRVSHSLGLASETTWRDVVEELHVRQRDIFEDSITDRLRETFG